MQRTSNGHNHKARHLKAVIYRKLGLLTKAEKLIHESLELDRFNFGVLYEHYLLFSDPNLLQKLKSVMRENIHNYIEYALDYFWAGQFEEALAILDLGISCQESVYPMAHYYKGWVYVNAGNQQSAKYEFELAEQCLSDYCFPNQLESISALQSAIKLNPKGDKAYYYLGNFWYAARQVEDAVQCWENSRKLNPLISYCSEESRNGIL